VIPPYFSIKEAVFPFNKFPGVDPILGPEMRSTGEVMGVGKTFGEAFVKSQMGAGKKSIALSVRLQPSDKTLTEADIEAVCAKIIDKVSKATGGVLRS
jgi:carbamoylphosphate synthase large subunit